MERSFELMAGTQSIFQEILERIEKEHQ
jgi:hypothetical protein